MDQSEQEDEGEQPAIIRPQQQLQQQQDWMFSRWPPPAEQKRHAQEQQIQM